MNFQFPMSLHRKTPKRVPARKESEESGNDFSSDPLTQLPSPSPPKTKQTNKAHVVFDDPDPMAITKPKSQQKDKKELQKNILTQSSSSSSPDSMSQIPSRISKKVSRLNKGKTRAKDSTIKKEFIEQDTSDDSDPLTFPLSHGRRFIKSNKS